MEDAGLTDAEAREIARRMIADARTPPAARLDAENNATSLDEPPRGAYSAADEARIERALVDLGFVPPDTIEDP